jgi:hypothetical protein
LPLAPRPHGRSLFSTAVRSARSKHDVDPLGIHRMPIAAGILASSLLFANPFGPTLLAPVAADRESSVRFEPIAVVALPFVGETLRHDADLAALLARIDGPTLLTGVVLADGRAVDLRVEPHRVIDAAIDVRLGERSRPDLADRMRTLVQLRGSIQGDTGSLVHLAVSERGIAGWIDRGSRSKAGGGRFTLRSVDLPGPGLQRGTVRFDRSDAVGGGDMPLCGGAHGCGAKGGRDEGGIAGDASIPAGAVPIVEIAIDTDYEYFRIFEDPVAASEYIAALYGAVGAIYRRDVGIGVELTYLRLFDVPEDLFNEPDPLFPFRDWWNANQQSVPRDLAHFVTGRRNLPYGGVAWLDATCGNFGYAVNGVIIGSFADPVATNPGNWDINVTAHELGHNLSSLHTHSYGLDSCNAGQVRRGSIMSYCHIVSGASSNVDLEFHVVCTEDMRAYIGATACLASDCDGDGIEDALEIAAGAVDLDGDGVPDACQDCDGDGVLDSAAIAAGLVADLDADGRPDGCERDCNENGVPDELDIANGTSTDAYGNGVPDECEADLDGDGISDRTEINLDMTLDKSRDGVLDAYEDCDGDGIDDFTELAGSRSIWTGTTDGTVRELHPRSGVLVRSFPMPAEVWDLAFGPDGRLYVASGKQILRIDRAAGTTQPFVGLGGGAQAFRGIAFAADGTLLAARTPNGVARYDASGAFLGWLGGDALAVPAPRDVAVRADGRVLVTCGDGRIRQFNAAGAAIAGFDGSGQAHDYFGVLESPDQAFIVVASRGQQGLVRFDAATGAYLGRFDVQFSNFLSRASGIALAADGVAYLATNSPSSSTVNGYDTTTGYLERTYRSYPLDAGTAQAIAVAPASATDQNGNLVPDECEAGGPSADLDGDGVVNAADLAILLGAWGTAGADLDGDGTTDAADLAILLGAWTVG